MNPPTDVATRYRSAAAMSRTRYFSSISMWLTVSVMRADPANRRPTPGRRGTSVTKPWVSAMVLSVSNVSTLPGAPFEDLGPLPAAVRLELPRPPVVGEHQVDDRDEARAGLTVLDGHDRLDPPVEVAVHEVGRTDVPLPVATVLERPDPRVLEELADDRADPDVLGQPGEPRLDGAPGADDHVDADARLRRPIQRLDRGHVDDGVELEHDVRRPARPRVRDLPIHELEEPRTEAVRRDEQPPERVLARQAGQDVEQVRHVRTDLRATGQQPEVHVQPRRLGVVVARPDVDVAAQPGSLAADHQGRLRVRLETRPAHTRRGRRRARACAPRRCSPPRRSGP